MKNAIVIATIIVSGLQGISVYGQNTNTKEAQKEIESKTDTIKVYGNCGICEKRIEGALKSVNGIHSANWNVETKMLAVDYDEKQVTLETIHQKVTDVGHDTDKAKAKDSVYNNLMGCCKYERPKNK